MKNNKSKKTVIIGRISTTAKGAGYIDDVDPKKESIYIEPGFLNTALDGDKVEVTVGSSHSRGKTEKTGKVLKVVERARESFVGTVIFEDDGRCLIIPDDRKMYTNIAISEQNSGELKADQKVFVKLLEWIDPAEIPEGRIERIIGEKGNNNVEMESIVLESGFEVGFPMNVEKEAKEIGANKTISAGEIAKRRDMRGTPTFTIDPFGLSIRSINLHRGSGCGRTGTGFMATPPHYFY